MKKTIYIFDKNITFYDLNNLDCVDKCILTGQWYEQDNLNYILNLNSIGGYIDIGAYIGTHSIYFSAFCPQTIVYSFEPQHDIFNKLKKNLRLNNLDNTHCFNVALSNNCSTKSLTKRSGNNSNSSASIEQSKNNYENNYSVTNRTLDSFDFNNISLLKIDIENHELNCLEGAIKTIKNNPLPHIFVESWPENICCLYKVPYIRKKLDKFLISFNFQFKKELSNHLLHYQRTSSINCRSISFL